MRGRALLGAAATLIRCYITDRLHCTGDLLDVIARNARDGVDYIQLREKDLSVRGLVALAQAALAQIAGTRTRLLVNGRADVVLASGAHGLHLPSGSVAVGHWRRVLPAHVIGVSCHTSQDLEQANGADYVLFGPVFDTPGKGPAIGIAGLAEAVKLTRIPVLALGGITRENAEECVRAGAAGIAGIRLFQH